MLTEVWRNYFQHWKTKGTPDSHGTYSQPIRWTMPAADVVALGVDHYVDSVNAWARSVQDTIKAGGNER